MDFLDVHELSQRCEHCTLEHCHTGSLCNIRDELDKPRGAMEWGKPYVQSVLVDEETAVAVALDEEVVDALELVRFGREGAEFGVRVSTSFKRSDQVVFEKSQALGSPTGEVVHRQSRPEAEGWELGEGFVLDSSQCSNWCGVLRKSSDDAEANVKSIPGAQRLVVRGHAFVLPILSCMRDICNGEELVLFQPSGSTQSQEVAATEVSSTPSPVGKPKLFEQAVKLSTQLDGDYWKMEPGSRRRRKPIVLAPPTPTRKPKKQKKSTKDVPKLTPPGTMGEYFQVRK